jgi:hypothetical protein
MKKGNDFKLEDNGSNVDLTFDWKENPGDVMEKVDKFLQSLGYEVVSHETQSDFYAYSIKRICNPR